MNRFRQQGKWDMGEMGCIFACLLLLAAIVYPFRHTPAQSVDVWYRAGWIVGHWGELPKGANLCAARFCTNFDTTKKYIGGNPGRMSESHMRFCRDHESDLPRTSSRFDNVIRFVYWLVSMALSCIEGAIALGLLFLPFGLLVGAFRKGKMRETVEGTLGFAALLSVPATLVAWFMFAWW